jgi:hypothetical protein
LFNDYFNTLYEMSRNSTDPVLQEIGELIKGDFIDFASRLDSCAEVFFHKDLMKMKLKVERGRHRYPRDHAVGELGKTELFRQKQRIIDSFGKDRGAGDFHLTLNGAPEKFSATS